jgi:hypothetical protein
MMATKIVVSQETDNPIRLISRSVKSENFSSATFKKNAFSVKVFNCYGFEYLYH